MGTCHSFIAEVTELSTIIRIVVDSLQEALHTLEEFLCELFFSCHQIRVKELLNCAAPRNMFNISQKFRLK